MTLQYAQTWYVEETVATASPAKLLTLLYDRLARDLAQARAALASSRSADAQPKLDHARDIITELLATLNGSWDGAADLARIYAWMTSQIISAGIRCDPEPVAAVHQLVLQLGEAWHAAAEAVDGPAAASA